LSWEATRATAPTAAADSQTQPVWDTGAAAWDTGAADSQTQPVWDTGAADPAWGETSQAPVWDEDTAAPAWDTAAGSQIPSGWDPGATVAGAWDETGQNSNLDAASAAVAGDETWVPNAWAPEEPAWQTDEAGAGNDGWSATDTQITRVISRWDVVGTPTWDATAPDWEAGRQAVPADLTEAEAAGQNAAPPDAAAEAEEEEWADDGPEITVTTEWETDGAGIAQPAVNPVWETDDPVAVAAGPDGSPALAAPSEDYAAETAWYEEPLIDFAAAQPGAAAIDPPLAAEPPEDPLPVADLRVDAPEAAIGEPDWPAEPAGPAASAADAGWTDWGSGRADEAADAENAFAAGPATSSGSAGSGQAAETGPGDETVWAAAPGQPAETGPTAEIDAWPSPLSAAEPAAGLHAAEAAASAQGFGGLAGGPDSAAEPARLPTANETTIEPIAAADDTAVAAGSPPAPEPAKAGRGGKRRDKKNELSAAAVEASGRGDAARPNTRPSLRAALGWIILTALIPGLGLLKTGHKVLGTVLLAVEAALLAVVVLALLDPGVFIRFAVNPVVLRLVLWAGAGLGLVWVAVLLATYISLKPRRGRPVGFALVTILALVAAGALAWTGPRAADQAKLLDAALADSKGDHIAASGLTAGSPLSPWSATERVNLLLLGLGQDSATGTGSPMAESILVASIDTRSGNTLLIGVPRSLTQTPFPDGSSLQGAFPKGWYDGSNPANTNYQLGAMYDRLPMGVDPALYPSSNLGAEAMKLAVGAALGLTLDYYVAIGIDTMAALVDAAGGVTVNVNKDIPLTDRILAAGADQRLTGQAAAEYLSNRSDDDSRRVARTRCVVYDLLAEIDFVSVLGRLSADGFDATAIRSDIPPSLAGPLAELALRARQATTTGMQFVNNNDGFLAARPDFTVMRESVKTAIAASLAPAGLPVSPQSYWQTQRMAEFCQYDPQSGW
jgi:anionic cell wall polymer biosynthesis LytR-Cps2A-Psr (LCP) family protein